MHILKYRIFPEGSCKERPVFVNNAKIKSINKSIDSNHYNQRIQFFL